MHPQDLRFAVGHTLSNAIRILLEGDTLAELAADAPGTPEDVGSGATQFKGFARYAYLDAASRNIELARALHAAARKTEINTSLTPNRRRIEPDQFANQLINLRASLDDHGLPYDFYAIEALQHASSGLDLATPHLSDINTPTVLSHVVQRWSDPVVRSKYPLQLDRWDRRFQHKRKAGSPQHQAMYEVIQQRVADFAAIGGDPSAALRPLLGKFLPLVEAVTRFDPMLVEASQQSAPICDSTTVGPLPGAIPKPREPRRTPTPKQDVLAWAQETCPAELARMARKELTRRSPGTKPPPRPREKSAKQQGESWQRVQDLARARAVADVDARRAAVDGWVRTWITPEHLDAEPAAAATTWAGYRHLSPVERTELFNQTYIDVYRELHARYIDAAAGRHKQPVKAQLAANGLQVIRCLWKVRVLADALGLPYDMFLRAIMGRKLENGKWTHAGRPNQLFDDLDLACARGLLASLEIPEAVPLTSDRPGCFGYLAPGKHVPCTTCPVRSDCEVQVGRVHEHLWASIGTDDPQLQRKRRQDNARAKEYRARKKERKQAG